MGSQSFEGTGGSPDSTLPIAAGLVGAASLMAAGIWISLQLRRRERVSLHGFLAGPVLAQTEDPTEGANAAPADKSLGAVATAQPSIPQTDAPANLAVPATVVTAEERAVSDGRPEPGKFDAASRASVLAAQIHARYGDVIRDTVEGQHRGSDGDPSVPG